MKTLINRQVELDYLILSRSEKKTLSKSKFKRERPIIVQVNLTIVSIAKKAYINKSQILKD